MTKLHGKKYLDGAKIIGKYICIQNLGKMIWIQWFSQRNWQPHLWNGGGLRVKIPNVHPCFHTLSQQQQQKGTAINQPIHPSINPHSKSIASALGDFIPARHHRLTCSRLRRLLQRVKSFHQVAASYIAL